MNAKSSDPFELFQISRNFLSTQQKFLPSGQIFEQLAEYTRNVTQAQIAYNQALMRAQASLFAAMMERPLAAATGKTEERPSSAAHHRDVSAP
ncbi:MAG TPA: hypothetical protein VLT37_02490 [Acidocella sp.]|nr:hypothetical protein [Acidocella sp.]